MGKCAYWLGRWEKNFLEKMTMELSLERVVGPLVGKDERVFHVGKVAVYVSNDISGRYSDLLDMMTIAIWLTWSSWKGRVEYETR